MKRIPRAVAVGILLLFCASSLFAGGSEEEVKKEGRYGGTLVIAISQTIAHLDPDKSTDGNLGQIIDHVYEGLFEIDESYKPVPFLVDSYEKTDDGKMYSFKLREGVHFHNGKEMTSEDVKASMERWLINNGGGKSVAPYVESVEAPGTYEIVVKFKEPYAPFLSFLSSIVANQKLRIRPKELIEKYGNEVMEEPVGTGPYQLVEWLPDQHVKLKRFENYSAHSGPSFAYSGKKEAYCDELIFKFVQEQSVRVAGVQTGEYHFAEEVPTEQLSIFEANPEIQIYIINSNRQGFIIINKGTPPFDNIYARQALLYALNLRELTTAVIGDEKFWYLEPSLFPPGNVWNDPDAGAGKYNNYDPDKARELLKKAGYDGSPIIMLNGSDRQVEVRTTLAVKDQLAKVGITVDPQLYDRATVVKQRRIKDAWSLHASLFFCPDPDPQVYGAWMGTNKWIGNWDDEDSRKIDDIFMRMQRETDTDKRYEIVKEWYEAFFEYVPYVKLYYSNTLHLGHNSLKGFESFTRWHFHNCWIEG
jgi:peptide/nickel transport system substrate-binding protein